MSENGGRLETGDLVGERWQVSHVLGVGDLGEVYEAYDVIQSSAGAVKLLAPQVLANRSSFDAFARAAQKGSELLGPRAARIDRIDVDGASGSPFIVSEKVKGSSLEAHVKGGNLLSAERVLELLRALAPWLDRAHAAGLAHGNLKPSNVFLLADGGVCLTDFGLGALRDDPWAGPPAFCAPELFEAGAKPSPRSDLYGLALVVFFALTGKHAFAAADPLDRQRLAGTARAGLRAASARAAALGTKLDLRLDRWFFVALDAKPENRFKTASDMAVSFGRQLGITVELEEPRVEAKPEQKVPEKASTPAGNGTSAHATNGATDRNADSVAPRPMVVLDATPPAGAVGSGIAAISLKPLLFASDLPAPPEQARAEAPAPALPKPEPVDEAAPRAPALHPEAPRGESEPTLARFETRAPEQKVLAEPAPNRVEAGVAKTVAASDLREAPAELLLASKETESPIAAKRDSVTMPLSVVAAAAAAILGIGIAMLALVLWFTSERRDDHEQRRTADAGQSVTSKPPGSEATHDKPSTGAPATAQSQAAQPQAAPAKTEPASEEAKEPSEAPAEPAASAAVAAPDETPLPAGMASLTVQCSPVACQDAFCDAKRYDATKPILLRAGKHVCKGVLSGHTMKGIELHLDAGQRRIEHFELLPKREEPAPKTGKKKPCGTFINPCK